MLSGGDPLVWLSRYPSWSGLFLGAAASLAPSGVTLPSARSQRVRVRPKYQLTYRSTAPAATSEVPVRASSGREFISST